MLLLSTGVIGRRIKMGALLEAVPKLAASLGSSAEDAHHAAVAITTTDLVSKSAAIEVGTQNQSLGKRDLPAGLATTRNTGLNERHMK